MEHVLDASYPFPSDDNDTTSFDAYLHLTFTLTSDGFNTG